MKIEFWWRHIFEILIIHKPSLWSRDVPQKIWPDRFSRFDVYWIQTNKQTDTPNLYIDLQIDCLYSFLIILISKLDKIHYLWNITENPVYGLSINFTKELSFCHKLWFSKFNIVATQCRGPLIFQTLNSVRSNNVSLKYQRFHHKVAKI